MAIISGIGLASGLDINSIVTQLVAAESRPLQLIAEKKSAIQSKLSAFGTLQGALASFQTTLANLSSASKFDVQSTQINGSGSFSASANGKATNAEYAVTVNQLAQSQKLASSGFASKSSSVGSGTLTITLGSYDGDSNTFSPQAGKTPISITIAPGSESLEQVRDAINQANAGVSATIINDGSAQGNRLVITAQDSGTANSIKIDVVDDDGNSHDSQGLSQLAFDPTLANGSGKNLTQMQEARNALLNIDGIDIVKSGNTISDAIEGVTLNLLKVSDGTASSLSVSTDTEAIEASVAAFVNAYNDLNNAIRKLTSYNETTKTAAALTGDATARNIAFDIRSMLTNTINSGGALSSLSQIGVSFQTDGTLALDSTKLQEKISSDFADIAKLFAVSATSSDPGVHFVAGSSKTQAGPYAIYLSQLGSDTEDAMGTINGVAASGAGTTLRATADDPSSGLIVKVTGDTLGDRGTVTYSVGIAAQLHAMITALLDEDGILASRTAGLDSSMTRLDREQEAQEARLLMVENRYRAQFTALESMINSMNSTSSYLAQQLAQISANNSN